MIWTTLFLTFKLAAITTGVLFIICVPLARWLQRTNSIHKAVIETVITLPLVLPPTIIGFYMLLAFSPGGVVGSWLDELFGIQLVFSFEGLVVASVIYSFPFMLHPLKSGMESLPGQYKESVNVLGKSYFEELIQVTLPNIKSSIITGVVLTFVHTIGEFGVVLMIGGSVPGVTKVASIAIYEEVESLNYIGAHKYSLLLVFISFAVLLVVYVLNAKNKKINTF